VTLPEGEGVDPRDDSSPDAALKQKQEGGE
jgi:hypothetical protein